ncbi:MAG: DUF3160 domain-containing protein [Clostridia bacterium]|nr:DUF3160 domain-containing protein [Clostridia bacterium]
MKRTRKLIITWICLSTVFISSVALTACAVKEKSIILEKETNAENENQIFPVKMGNRKFLIQADKQEALPAFTPSVEDYTVNADLSNIENLDRYYLDDQSKQKLVDNQFVVINTNRNEFHDMYEENRYLQMPNFVTVDSIMHTYHLYFAMLLRHTERDYLIDTLSKLSLAMQEASVQQYEILKGSEWEESAKINVAFFTVANSLAGHETTIPDYVKDIVEEELQLVSEASDISRSPLNGEDEDYTQYKPRGYYDGDEALEKYFKTMMWYGRRNFFQNKEILDRSALLMTIALRDDAFTNWEKIYSITSFFAGASDDSGFYEYMPLVEQAYGADVQTEDLIGDQNAFQIYHALTAQLDPPVINSVAFEDDGGETDKTGLAKGYRFMGQRFSVDAAIFTQLCYSKVKEKPSGEMRLLPDSLDVPAALGSETALAILKDQGNFEYKNYEKNMMLARTKISEASDLLWNASLYGKWLDTLRPLLDEKGKGYPSFMQSEEWNKKDLETFLSSFTELKHDTILYSKQFMAEMGGGDEPCDDRGYVEPEVQVYHKLSNLTKSTSEGLDEFGVLNDNDRENLKRLSDLSIRLRDISIKELTGDTITEDDYELIRSYGGNIEHFWAEAIKEKKEEEGDDFRAEGEFPAALVVDVATDPSGSVLEQAIGGVASIYVVVPVDGKLRIAEGGVYSYYQFIQPMGERMTDSEWRRKLGIEVNDNLEYEPDESIKQPEWTQSYRIQREY